jgi:hypothetical protein
MTSRLTIEEIHDHHALLLADFFRQTWNPTSTPEAVSASRQIAAARNPCEPGKAPPTFAAIMGDRIVGYCSSIPLRLWHRGVDRTAYWAKGLMVLPEFQGGPIGYHVLSALTKSQPLMAAVTVAPASRRLFAALGYHDHGAIPNLVRPTQFRMAARQLRPTSLELSPSAKLLGSAAEVMRAAGVSYSVGAVADAVGALIWRCPVGAHTAVSVERALVEAEVDQLWSSVREDCAAGPVRDGRAWGERYSSGSPGDYSFVTLRTGGRLEGVAVLRSLNPVADPRLAGVRMASVSDLLIHPDNPNFGALLAGAEREAARIGAGAVILTASNRIMIEQARRRGYWQRAGNIHFFLRSPERQSDQSIELERWWLCRGDGESDSTF